MPISFQLVLGAEVWVATMFFFWMQRLAKWTIAWDCGALLPDRPELQPAGREPFIDAPTSWWLLNWLIGCPLPITAICIAEFADRQFGLRSHGPELLKYVYLIGLLITLSACLVVRGSLLLRFAMLLISLFLFCVLNGCGMVVFIQIVGPVRT